MRILFHDDLDGAASAAVLNGFLEDVVGERGNNFLPVNFHLETDWLFPQLPFLNVDERFAIVDFLYHPAAEVWFDHHPTAFKTGMYRAHFESRKASLLQWDTTAPSCARLIYETLRPIWSSAGRMAELVEGADMIDQARYPSVEAYFDAKHPAIAINHAWSRLDEALKDRLIRTLTQGTLQDGLAAVRPQMEEAKQAQHEILSDYRQYVDLRGTVAVTDVGNVPRPFVRYASYSYFPQALYSLALYRPKDENAVYVSIGKNPWIAFEHAHLGELAKRWGGGGHAYAAGMEFRGRDHTNPYLAALTAANTLVNLLNGN